MSRKGDDFKLTHHFPACFESAPAYRTRDLDTINVRLDETEGIQHSPDHGRHQKVGHTATSSPSIEQSTPNNGIPPRMR